MKMTASSRGSRVAASLIRSSRHLRVCSDCINHITQNSSLSQRSYSAAAAALKTDNGTSHDMRVSNLPPLKASSSPDYKIKSGILLSRPPLLTRPLNSFEKAFFFYQKRLNERLTMPFTRYFYFKKDTPADHDWKLKAKERGGQPARELGGYNPYGELGWNDELLVGDGRCESQYMVESLVKDAEVRAVEGKDGKTVETEDGAGDGEGGKIDRPLSPWTEADKAKDLKRLDRKLARTLYLAVKRENGGWGLPAGELVGRENLHQAAERVLVQTAGLNMNTWIVGHAPAGHHIIDPYLDKERSERTIGEKTFFMRARIMAGQANLKDNLFGLSDFKWLTKQELQKHVGPKYFSSIKNMLADR